MRQIGRFQVERNLGGGTFASVWLAVDPGLQARVAIKVLAENWALDPDIKRRFLEEARIMRRLDHPRITRVYEVADLEDGRPYFIMEYADRGTLHERMRHRHSTGQGFSIDEALEISKELAECVQVAHDIGVVHRDLKPSNILYRSIPAHHQEEMRRRGIQPPAEQMMLGDFGIARNLEAATQFTVSAGTPHYMAPEQAQGKADGRSDVYGCAAILFELLAGETPYHYSSIGEIIRAQLTGPPPSILQRRSDAPDDLDRVMHMALATNPDKRIPTARAWGDALSRITTDLRPAPSPTPTPRPAPGPTVPAPAPPAPPPAQAAPSPVAAPATVGVTQAAPPRDVPVPESPPVAVGDRATPPPEAPPTGGRRLWPWLAVLLLVAVAASVVTVIVLNQRDDTSPTLVFSEEPAGPVALEAGIVSPEDLLGWAIGTDGTTALVGAPFSNPDGSKDAGRAWVFTRSGDSWSPGAPLTPPRVSTDARFGMAVAVSGNTMLVGAPGSASSGLDGAGEVWEFTRSDGSWLATGSLLSPEPAAGDAFGSALALSGDMAAVGAPGVGSGEVWVFTRSGSQWSNPTRVVPTSQRSGDAFGSAIGLDGATLVVGAPRSPSLMERRPDGGRAWVFSFDGEAWGQADALATEEGPEHLFGAAVAVHGDTVVVGAPMADDVGLADTGAAWAFTRNGSRWDPVQLRPGAQDAGDRFGASVAIGDRGVLVGAPGGTASTVIDAGRVWHFAQSPDRWAAAAVEPVRGSAEDGFGSAVALHGDAAVVGAPYANPGGISDAGRAWVITLPE